MVIGPESTGKSTLSEALAKELNTVWVPEYARGYIDDLKRSYIEEDLLQIAKSQVALEDNMLHKANDFLVCDTDLNVIKVWSEHAFKRCHVEILEQIAQRKYDLYLLTNIDIPWTEDPQREHPDMRGYFYNIYLDIVQNSGVKWLDIRGTHDERLRAAKAGVKAL